MRIFFRIFELLDSKERKRGSWILLLVLGMAFIEVLGVASIMPFLAVMGNPQVLETNLFLNYVYNKLLIFNVNTPEDFFVVFGVFSFLLLITSALYKTFTHYSMNLYIETLRHNLSTRFLKNYLEKPYAFFLDRNSGDLSKIILSEVDLFVAGVIRPIFNMLAYFIISIFIISLLLVVDFFLAISVAGLLVGLYFIIYIFFKSKLARIGIKRVEANKNRFMAVTEVFGGIKDIKLLGCEQNYINRFTTPSNNFALANAANQTINQVPKYLIESIAFGGMLAVIVFLILSSGGLGVGSLSDILPIVGLYAFSAYRLQPALHFIFQGFSSLRSGEATLDALQFDFKIKTPNSSISKTYEKLKIEKNITLTDINYRYPASDVPILKNIHLNIPVHTSLGIVGGTGAGKTTLVDLILGLLTPSSGHLMVDGKLINDVLKDSWQQSLGYVRQDIFLSDASIAENIAFGIPKDDINLDQVVNCAKLAHIHKFIQNDLINQYETNIGERGIRLSGGQRQRIAIARALYRDPEVLVFDEATSALDNITEKVVIRAINELANKKTIILIAHRLSTVKNCDQIIVLEHGSIIAKGEYGKLISHNDVFRNLAVSDN